MSHEHHHHHEQNVNAHSLNKAFTIGIVLNLVFVFTEFGAGFWFDSLALLSDAGHNLSDVVSLILTFLAFRLEKVKANNRYTYGYKKSTILVSLLNAVILLVAVGGILVESIDKLQHPQEVSGTSIAWVAGIGVLINGFTAFLFLKDKEKDLNIKGAYLHMAADALVSIGVLAAGIVIHYTGWYMIDPIIGIVIVVVILISTWNLLHDSIRLSLDGVPVGMDREKVMKLLMKTAGVKDVHHLHIWAISTTEIALTTHIVVDDMNKMEDVKHRIRYEMEHCGISHVTLEFESKDCGTRCMM
ncbi:Cadmium cobalt and zinc/H(+)-K(+) antiporter [termite gut metagenome]|uniref:Cadmium cobalt and zinc/H(+)-K(+) antiporter n=1 Tax=termite gut metagenome TaxID=433724 RepID=A0A5J4SHX8_9ZZZZ